MNKDRGSKVMGMLREVTSMDVDVDDKVSGAFMRARVSIEVNKPLRRGVLQTRKNEEAKWSSTQYEKLPFYCVGCGIMGHSELECSKPVPRNAEGKLPYDIMLRAPEDRRKKMQSFSEAAAESFGSRSTSGPHSRRVKPNKTGEPSIPASTSERHSTSARAGLEAREVEV